MNPKIKLPVGSDITPPVVPTTPVLIETEINGVKYNLNEIGDAVDDKGAIIKTKAEIEALKTNPPSEEEQKKAAKLLERTTEIESQLIEGAEIELDGVKYVLNKDGNIVKDGAVFKTKADLKNLLLADESDDTPENYVSSIQEATNLVIVGENNEPVSYENTLPGLTQYVQDVHRNGQELGASQYEEQLFNKFPILKEVIDHLTITNGSLNGFTEQTDYSNVTVGDDENQQIDLYTKAQLARGVSMTEITDMVKYLKEDKKLKTYAESALSYLKANQDQRTTERANAIAQLQAQEEAENTAYWNNVDTILRSKVIEVGDKKFSLPEVIRVKEGDGKVITKSLKDFEDYIKKPINVRINNKVYTMTRHDYDEYLEDTKRTPHHDLFEAFRRFTKYDDSQIIAANASSSVVKKVIKLKSKTSGGGSGNASTGKIVLPIK